MSSSYVKVDSNEAVFELVRVLLELDCFSRNVFVTNDSAMLLGHWEYKQTICSLLP